MGQQKYVDINENQLGIGYGHKNLLNDKILMISPFLNDENMLK